MIFLPHFLYYTVPTFYLFGLLIMHNAAQHNYVISLTTEQKRRKHI
ncbi:TPA: lipooligosaccharide biosynthesis protein lpsA, partial [Haemophilus influenzae]